MWVSPRQNLRNPPPVPDSATVIGHELTHVLAQHSNERLSRDQLTGIGLAVADAASSDDQLRAFQHTIFTQDQPVLESQRPRRLPVSDDPAVQELHCAADRSAAAYRRHLRALGITHGVC